MTSLQIITTDRHTVLVYPRSGIESNDSDLVDTINSRPVSVHIYAATLTRGQLTSPHFDYQFVLLLLCLTA